MGRKKTGAGDFGGIRALLLDDHRRRVTDSRWGGPPAVVDEYEAALAAGEEVVVAAGVIMVALSDAGLPHRDFAFGGRYSVCKFLLGEDDSLTIWTPPERESHCGPDRSCYQCAPQVGR